MKHISYIKYQLKRAYLWLTVAIVCAGVSPLAYANPAPQTATESVMVRAGYVDAVAFIAQLPVIEPYPFRRMAEGQQTLMALFVHYPMAFWYFFGRYEAFMQAADLAGEP